MFQRFEDPDPGPLSSVRSVFRRAEFPSGRQMSRWGGAGAVFRRGHATIVGEPDAAVKLGW